MSWGRRLLAGLAVVLTVALIVVVVAYNRLSGNIQGIDIGGNRTDAAKSAAGDNAPLNILLLGSDTRVGQGALSDKKTAGARSDTAILLHLSADRDYAVAASVPRDSMVAFPECAETDPQTNATVSPAARRRQFNDAFAVGGPVCTIKVVEKNTGVFIDHFAVVDFSGFQSMVNALGGVSICVPKPIKDSKSHLDIPAGTQTLDGDQALAFVRTRHAVGDGSDLDRIKLQQAFLSAMIRQATDAKLLLQPAKLFRFLDAATKSLTTDKQLASIDNLTGLARQMQNVKPANIHFVTVPTEAYPPNRNRVQWTSGASGIWKAMRDDTPLPGTTVVGSKASPRPTTTTGTTIDPAQVHVRLLNRSGVTGLAKQASAALQAQGFDVASPGTQAVSTARGVVIRYPEGQSDAATTLAAAFPDADVQIDYSLTGDTVLVEMGAGSPDVKAVPSSSATSLPPQPIKATRSSSSASTPSVTAQNAAEDDLCK